MKNLTVGDIRLLLISPSLDHWGTPELGRVFQDLIQLKLKGYGAHYPAGVLPIDTTDFYAHHLVIGYDSKGQFRPLMSGKTTTLSRVDFHRHAFPALSLVQQAQAPEHISVVQSEIERCRIQKKELGYFGSWTVDPEIKKNPELQKYLKQIFPGLYVHFHLEMGVQEIMLGGTLRFRTESVFESLGHKPLCQGDRVLPNIRVRHLFDEPVQVMHLKKFSVAALHEAQKTETLWKDRQTLGSWKSVLVA